METYTRLALGERYHVETSLRLGLTLAAIALLVGAHKSTISRELARNGGRDGYDAEAAQPRANALVREMSRQLCP